MSISTLKIARRLKAKGFIESQAEGIAEELVEAVGKSDLVTKDFLSTKFAEVKTEIGEVKIEMKSLKIDAIKWLVGLQFASLAISLSLTGGLIYFLLSHLL